MARPKKARKVCFEPNIAELIKTKNGRGCVELTVDEYETLRLIDYMGLTQYECALQMEVARSTIAAIYENARYKISDSLVNGKSIKISGGDYILCKTVLIAAADAALIPAADAITELAKDAREYFTQRARNVTF